MRARHILHGSVTAVVRTDERTADFELSGRDMGYDAVLVRGGKAVVLGGFTAGHAGPFEAQGAEAFAVVDRRDGRIVSRGGDGGVDWAWVRVALASAYAPPEPAPAPELAAEPVVSVSAQAPPTIDIPEGAKVFGFAVNEDTVTEAALPDTPDTVTEAALPDTPDTETEDAQPEDTQAAEYDSDIWTQADAEDAVLVQSQSEPDAETEDTEAAEEAPEGFMPEPAAAEPEEREAVPVSSRGGWQGGAHPQARAAGRSADGRRVAPFEGAYAAYDWVMIEQGRGHYLSGSKRGGSAIAIPGRYAPVVPERLSGFGDFAYSRDGTGYWIKTFPY